MGNNYALCIAITGLNANENPGPGVAVARALKAARGNKVKLIGLAYEALEPGIYIPDLFVKTYQIPYPAAGAYALLERLEQITAEEKIDLVIPNFDAELYNFIAIERQLLKTGIRTFIPSHRQLAMRDKLNLSAMGKQSGFNVPADVQITTETELYPACDKLSYPVVIKGKFYEAVVAYTADQAQKAFYQLSIKWGAPVIVQQFVKGTEINIAALGDGKGNNLSIIPMRKLHITDKGKAWAGVTIEGKDLIDLAGKFAELSKWKGGYELEIMRTADDKLYILEINPRFPAWIYLTAAAGQNQPAALAELAMGREVVKMKHYLTGKLFVRYSWDQVVDISDFQQMSAFGELKTIADAKAHV